ncbi:class F sortase [Actinoplanes sp. NPDC024001]|uniref:class F sortase n=1 Tax=Actinoplanes sp. NPDC024001 TaxID=3154598 RepID=UPI0033C64030
MRAPDDYGHGWIRDRRAAAFALILAVLGTVITAMGFRIEDGLPPPEAAAPAASPVAVEGTEAPPAPPPTRSAPPSPAGGTRRSEPARGMRRSEPVRLEIPAIKLRAPVTPIGLRRDGTIDVPPLRSDAPAGWYKNAPSPGETGAAVLVGHVDTARDGPAVFYRLRELRRGNPISVRRADGTVADFVVTKVTTHPKDDFPSADVYGPVDGPELRLITCGGVFDRSRGSYRSNVVVFARRAP